MFVDNFAVGDKVRVRFSWHGKYPIVKMLLREVAIASVLPDMLKSKVILFNKK